MRDYEIGCWSHDDRMATWCLIRFRLGGVVSPPPGSFGANQNRHSASSPFLSSKTSNELVLVRPLVRFVIQHWPAGATRFFVILPKTETPTSSPDDLMKSSSARKNRQGWFGFKILDSQINIGGYTLQPNHTLFFCLVGLTSRYYMNYHVKSNNSWKLAFCPRKLYKT